MTLQELGSVRCVARALLREVLVHDREARLSRVSPSEIGSRVPGDLACRGAL